MFVEYIAWRAAEEGVSHLIDSSVRRYDPSNAVEEVEQAIENEILAISSATLFNGPHPPAYSCPVSKQGNGQGFFANYKWKEKLLCVLTTGYVIYFDSTDINDSNKPSRCINIAGAYVEIPNGPEPSPETLGSMRSTSGKKTGGGVMGWLGLGADPAKGKIDESPPHVFRLVTPSRNFLFACRSEEELGRTVDAIRACVAHPQRAAPPPHSSTSPSPSLVTARDDSDGNDEGVEGPTIDASQPPSTTQIKAQSKKPGVHEAAGEARSATPSATGSNSSPPPGDVSDDGEVEAW